MKYLIFFFIALSSLMMKQELKAQPKKVIVVVDKSGSMSIVNESLKPKIEDILPLLKYVKNNGGEVAFSIIGNNSKEYLQKYRHNGQTITKPKKTQGMSNRDYQQLLIEYAKASKATGNSGGINSFIKSAEMQNIFSDNYGGGSDVDGAIELANLYLTENDPELANAEKYAIIISDGLNNVVLYNAPNQFCCNMIVTYLSNSIGGLQKYNPQITTSLKTAVNSIIK